MGLAVLSGGVGGSADADASGKMDEGWAEEARNSGR